MKNISIILSAVTIALMSFTSCNSGSSSPSFEGFVRHENGLNYKFFNHDENGTHPQIGDNVMLRYQFMIQRNDSVILDSKDATPNPDAAVEINMREITFKGSLEDGILLMCKGDSAAFIVPADSFFLKTMRMNELPQFINSGDNIKAVIKLISWKSKKEVEEQRAKQMAEREARLKQQMEAEPGLREKYLADNKIKTKPTASGLYYIETKKGSGGHPKATDVVKVHYTGKLLDGTVFDSSVQRGEPIEFPLNGVILGWTEGLQLMQKGGKANLIIPSSLAYGDQEGGPIPAFSTLVFEVELLDFHEAPQQAMPQGAPQQGADGHNH